jgi:putative flavoprotein involved in K+ transport
MRRLAAVAYDRRMDSSFGAAAEGAMNTNPERVQTVVIGGGQAGLSVGYHLKQRGMPFVILDAGQRVGDSWRHRWDSLRLFSPARFDGLDGMPFPAAADTFPTKDEMADYLERYAANFALPVRTGMKVDRLWRNGDRYAISCGDRRFEAEHVVVAMATYQKPHVPPFGQQLDPRIVQLHSVDYRSPAQLQEGGVLIVGAGNSGAEIAVEVARTHRTWLAGRATGEVPFRNTSRLALRVLLPVLFRVVFHRILTVATPIGRKARPAIIGKGGPLIRTRSGELAAAGVARVPRVSGVTGAGLPILQDGRALEVANVIWCTGFHGGFSWIDVDVVGRDGEPRHERGVVSSEPGLYFVGLHFLYAMSSSMIHGIGRDAERVVETIAARVAASRTIRSAA